MKEDDYEKKLAAIKRILKKLNICQPMLMEMLDAYNKRIAELNQKTFDYAENFIFPFATDDNHTLSQDDINILEGYKKRNNEVLEKEFPKLFEVMDDLSIFEDDNIF